jgi:hypothetical protein
VGARAGGGEAGVLGLLGSVLVQEDGEREMLETEKEVIVQRGERT